MIGKYTGYIEAGYLPPQAYERGTERERKILIMKIRRDLKMQFIIFI